MKWKEFDKAYDAYHRSALHVAYDVLQDYDLAQEVCLEVFVEYHEKMGKIGRKCAKGWILARAREKASGYRERTHRKEEAAADGETKRRGLVSEWELGN